MCFFSFLKFFFFYQHLSLLGLSDGFDLNPCFDNYRVFYLFVKFKVKIVINIKICELYGIFASNRELGKS